MEQQSSADDFKKNVLLLKPRDVTERGDHVFTPTLNILSKLRKTEQFKRDLVFSRNMSAVDVRKKLVEAFPELENKRFSCAKRDNRDSADLNFKGDRRVWDGKTIKKLPGSSAMYIFVEDETSQVQGAANDTDCLSAVQHPSSYTPPDLEGVKPGRFDAYWQDIVDVLNEDCKYSDGLRSCQSQTMQTASGRKISDSNEPNRIDVNTGEISETGYSSGANSTQAQGLCREAAVTTSVTRTSFRVYQPRETAYSLDEASSTQGQGLFQETVEATGTRNPSRLFHGRGTADSSEEGSSSKEQTFDVTMNPKSGRPEGGNRCFWLEFKSSLHSSVTSGWATFGPYGGVEVRRISDDDFTMFGKEIPRGRPGLVTVTITTKSGFYLGKAFFTYEDPENETNQQVLCNKRKIEELSDIVQNLAKMFKQQGLANQAGQVEPQKILKPLVYAAAEAGAMRLIETIFSLSAGKLAFQAYKEDIYLPEDIAEENGHTDVAAYLRATTKRYSEEYDISTDRSRSVAFDWTELANALEDIELYQSATKPSSDKDLNQVWEDDIIETGYSADGETSSSGSEKEKSDSDVELVKMSACRESRDDEKQQQLIVLVRENPLESPEKSSYCSQWLSDCGKAAQVNNEEDTAMRGSEPAPVDECCNEAVDEPSSHSLTPHPTTSTFRPKSARIEILHHCRQLSDDVRFGQANGYPVHPYVTLSPYPFLVVQFVVAVKDEETKEIWECNATPDVHQIHITKDRMFSIVPELSEPCCSVLAHSVDCRNTPLPPYAGNLVFMLPVKHEMPYHYVVRIKLCKGVYPCDWQVLDVHHFFIASYKRGSKLCDFQSGRTITEVEKPVPKIQKQGVLAGEMGKAIRMHFQNLGDNGRYNQFLRDRGQLFAQVNRNAKYQDLLSAVLLEEATIYFAQNKMEDCLKKCWEVHARAMRHNSGNWPFLMTKAFYIISAVYRQRKEFDKAGEFMERSSECLEPASLSEETAVNRYNAAALMAEKSATFDLTPEEDREVERLFEEVAGIWSQQRENETLRCVIRSYNRMITYFLKTSRSAFPDLRKLVTETKLAKADEAIQKFEKNLLPHSPKRLEATFLIGKADYYIRRATRERMDITQQQRATDFQKATTVLEEAMRISQQLKMEKEIDGIQDRNETIQNLTRNGLDWLNERPPQNPPTSRDPREVNTDDLDDLLQNMFIQENE